MENDGDPTCENPEGSLVLLTLRTLLKDLLSIELPSLKVRDVLSLREDKPEVVMMDGALCITRYCSRCIYHC